VSARTIAVLVPTTSRGRRLRGAADTDLLRVLLPSLLRTATWDGSLAYRLYVGYDAGDPYFDTGGAADVAAAIRRLVGDRPLALALRRCEGTAHSPVAVWNHLFADAYAEGCDFFYQLGDDLALETAGWAREFPAALMLNPVEPGLGVTGPVDRGHCLDDGRLKLDVLTQSFVSRRHMEIFATYYPAAFRNWWSESRSALLLTTARTLTLSLEQLLMSGRPTRKSWQRGSTNTLSPVRVRRYLSPE